MALNDKEFSIQGVRFNIKKLGALASFRTLEKIRKAIASAGLADSLDMADMNGDQSEVMKKALSSLMDIDPEHIEAIRADLFPTVEFKTKEVDKGWIKLDCESMIDMAFAELPTTAIYEVLLRAMAVNFMNCFEGLNFLSKAKK